MSVTYHRMIADPDGGKERKSDDWAEYEGCAQLEMSELMTLVNGGAGALDLLCKVVKRVHIVRARTGEIITDLTPDTAGQLRAQVLDWLRLQTREAARDEMLDPEV